VLFFDEFDPIGKERGDVHETGEIKRVVTSLLMQMDDLPSYTVVVGASNHALQQTGTCHSIVRDQRNAKHRSVSC